MSPSSITSNVACSHCLLPVGRLGQRREVHGEIHQFCCYGCCLAFQVNHGERDEPAAAWLLIRLGVGGFLAMNIMLFSLLLYAGTIGPEDAGLLRAVHILLWALATPMIVILGGPFVRGAWQEARHGRITTDMLVSIGILAAYGYSTLQVMTGGSHVYFDTATMVLMLFTLGRYLEAIGRVRTARSLAPVLAAERATATVVVEDHDIEQSVRAIMPWTVVRVRPGERVAVDGVVIEGRSACDEAVLTGQPEPKVKQPGSAVFAGSVNGAGQLLVRATTAGADTYWVRMSRLVHDALDRTSPLGEIMDWAAALFVPAVLLLAIVTVWYWSSHGPFGQALMTGLAVLVVACPCSLGLAAPLATALGLGQAAQRGIVVRGGGVLERLAGIRAVAFDKTGTLTTGVPHLVDVMTDGVPQTELLRRAAALAQGSEHPIARAIAAAARERGLKWPPCSGVRAHPGEGVTGDTTGTDGGGIAMGSAAFMTKRGWPVPASLLERPNIHGYSLVYVGWGGQVGGLLRLTDTPLAEARAVITMLTADGLATCLLSGDTPAAAKRAADMVGINNTQAGLLPADKVAALRAWARRYGAVAMVGDGMNDAPVLAAATVGIAVGGATDLARESADITLPAGSLASLPWLIGLARRVRKTILTNIAWALGYNLAALSLAVAGLLQPAVAAGLMAGSSLVVVTRSLRAGHAPAQHAADTMTAPAGKEVMSSL
ncbi:MAG: heavy metal translocating P-type ATPase [Gammaproteobacteria bacterium]|nr:heavy metal translocating P-type ATPase [Gammaproteobacteria bacterium]